MVSIILSGCAGRMGRVVAALCAKESDAVRIVAGADINAGGEGFTFPVYKSVADIREEADVIIDFSFHAITKSLLDFAAERGLPVVLCTTGHTEEEKAQISLAATKVAIFRSANMSLGISLLTELCKRAASLLGDDFDIEIVEKHHNQKLDAPSGTALMIADAINSAIDNDKEYVYDRHMAHAKRDKREIGISSVRAGTIVGEHDVIFGGHDEVITISHSALSREVFAAGALRAAKYMSARPAKKPGIYNMEMMLNEEFM